MSIERTKLMYGCPVIDYDQIKPVVIKPTVLIDNENNDIKKEDEEINVKDVLHELVEKDELDKLIAQLDYNSEEFDYKKEIDYFIARLKDSLYKDSIQSINRCIRLWKMIYILKLGYCISKNEKEFDLLSGWNKINK